MADELLASYKAKYTAIDQRLDNGLTDSERPTVKAEIVTLFKSVEQQIAELTTLKDEIKQLVDKWKAQNPEFKKLHQKYERELRDLLKRRFDRFAILADLHAFAQTGISSTAAALDFAKSYVDDEDATVWCAVKSGASRQTLSSPNWPR